MIPVAIMNLKQPVLSAFVLALITAALSACGAAGGSNCVVYDAGASTSCGNPSAVYTWDGTRCLPTSACGCDGGTCANTYATQSQCLDDHRNCAQ